MTLMMAFCFVSVSALASYEHADAKGPAAIGAALVEFSQDRGLAPAPPAPSKAEHDDIAKGGDECPCKDKSDSLTLTCGVTLALSATDLGSDVFDVSQAWFAFGQPDSSSRLIYLLKRPPRYTF
ncbi:MAG: hypothetical protein AAF724_00260 [Pseudomonadota bacterium]